MVETLGVQAEWLLRVLVASVLGAMVGVERAWAGKPAGVRTHLAVSLGAAVMSAAGADGADNMRIAAQVVTGIGFLGAGLLLRDQTSVRGLTSAASVWAVAGVGIAVGIGWYWLGVGTTVILLIALGPLESVERRLIRAASSRRWRVTIELPRDVDAMKLSVWPALKLEPLQRSIALTGETQRITFETEAPAELDPHDFVAALRQAGASHVAWESLIAPHPIDPD